MKLVILGQPVNEVDKVLKRFFAENGIVPSYFKDGLSGDYDALLDGTIYFLGSRELIWLASEEVGSSVIIELFHQIDGQSLVYPCINSQIEITDDYAESARTLTLCLEYWNNVDRITKL